MAYVIQKSGDCIVVRDNTDTSYGRLLALPLSVKNTSGTSISFYCGYTGFVGDPMFSSALTGIATIEGEATAATMYEAIRQISEMFAGDGDA